MIDLIELIETQLTALTETCQRRQVARRSLFGSAARDDFDADRSDLDFAVEFAPLNPGNHATAYPGLADDLETRFGRPVDLIEIAAIRNPYLLRTITDQQTTLYAAA